jgi:hypothetical protein
MLSMLSMLCMLFMLSMHDIFVTLKNKFCNNAQSLRRVASAAALSQVAAHSVPPSPTKYSRMRGSAAASYHSVGRLLLVLVLVRRRLCLKWRLTAHSSARV